MSMISDIFPPQQRATAVGFFFLSTALGLLLANAAGGLIAERFGWRAAFWAAGAPGIVLAIVLMLTVREPKRGRHDAGDEKAGLLASIGYIAGHAAMRPLFIGMVLWAFCAASAAAFTVAFLQRSHGLSIAEAGFVSAIASGAFGAIGAAAGGMIADRLARRDPRAPYWFLAFGSAATACLALGAIFAPTILACALLLMAWHLVAGLYLGPSYGLAISLAPPRMRATSISILQVGANLLGYGVGPFLTGLLSDLFRGADSLRYSMACIVALYFVVAVLFAHAARARADATRGIAHA
jgi:predicted MFS family arabinose efflux permease